VYDTDSPWPNGAVHVFGKFISKKEAVAWIAAHSWLTMAITQNAIEGDTN
jgi:hypothetical protein